MDREEGISKIWFSGIGLLEINPMTSIEEGFSSFLLRFPKQIRLPRPVRKIVILYQLHDKYLESEFNKEENFNLLSMEFSKFDTRVLGNPDPSLIKPGGPICKTGAGGILCKRRALLVPKRTRSSGGSYILLAFFKDEETFQYTQTEEKKNIAKILHIFYRMYRTIDSYKALRFFAAHKDFN